MHRYQEDKSAISIVVQGLQRWWLASLLKFEHDRNLLSQFIIESGADATDQQ